MYGNLTEIITQALLKAFRFPELVTVLISVLPIVEARGAIPVAFSYGISPPLALLYAFLGSSLMAPVLIAVLLPFVKWLSKTKLFRKVGQTLYEKFEKKSQSILKEEVPGEISRQARNDKLDARNDKLDARNDQLDARNDGSEVQGDGTRTQSAKKNAQKKSDLRKMLGVFAFVAVPLPLTGVWTGSAVAALTRLSYPKALASVVAGNLVATCLITLLCVLLPQKAIDYVILAIGIIAVIVVAVLIVKIVLHKSPEDKESKKQDEENE